MKASNVVNTVSNFVYATVAVAVYDLGTLATLAAAGLCILTFGSARYHWLGERADNVLDRIGMLAVLVPVAFMAVAAVFTSLGSLAPVGAMVVLVALGLGHTKLYNHVVVVVLASIPLVTNVVLGGGWSFWHGQWIPVACFVMAGAYWLLDERRFHHGRHVPSGTPCHPDAPESHWNWLHSFWHLLTGVGWWVLIVQLMSQT